MVPVGFMHLGPNSGDLWVAQVFPQTGPALKRWDHSEARTVLCTSFQAVGSDPSVPTSPLACTELPLLVPLS